MPKVCVGYVTAPIRARGGFKPLSPPPRPAHARMLRLHRVAWACKDARLFSKKDAVVRSLTDETNIETFY